MIWSRLKKTVEALFVPELRGRVELRSVNYRGAPDQMGRGYITIDGAEVWSWADTEFFKVEYPRMALGESQDDVDADLLAKGISGQEGFNRSLEEYLNSSVDQNLACNDMLRRALCMIDRRVGARRLASIDLSNEHAIVQQLYRLRLEAKSEVVQ